MIYSFDSSAFINGWHRYYPPDIFPTIWSDIDNLSQEGRLIATEEVLKELEKKDDVIYEWAKLRPHIFRLLDEQIQLTVIDILRDFPRLIDNRRQRSGADPFVLALAQIEGASVVTFESPSSNLERPKIPDVCLALGVPCMTLLHLIRQEGWQYHK